MHPALRVILSSPAMGGGAPAPPPGFSFIVDENGAYLVDENGLKLLTEA